MPVSRAKIAHFVHLTHRDEVEPPLTEWLLQAYESSDELTAKAKGAKKAAKKGAKKGARHRVTAVR